MNQMYALNLAAEEIADRIYDVDFDERAILESFGVFSMTADEAKHLDILVNLFLENNY